MISLEVSHFDDENNEFSTSVTNSHWSFYTKDYFLNLIYKLGATCAAGINTTDLPLPV